MAVSRAGLFRVDVERLKALDFERTVVSYDRASDTLMVHFHGRGRAAVSVPLPKPLGRDFVFLRIDPATEELVGIQIEDFLNLYLPEHPQDAFLLQRAELRGMSGEERAMIVREPSPRGENHAAAETVLEEIARLRIGD